MKTYLPAKFVAERDMERCIRCKVCVNQCSFETHYHDVEDDAVRSREGNCVGCHRCAMFCPTQAITIKKAPMDYRENYNWRPEVIEDIIKQAETGGMLLTGMGDDKRQRIYWDHLVLNASQVTNPSIDPLREPMELTTYLGRKPDRVEIGADGASLTTEIAPQIQLDVPVMFAAMSYGASQPQCTGIPGPGGHGDGHAMEYRRGWTSPQPVPVCPTIRLCRLLRAVLACSSLPRCRPCGRDQDRPGRQAGHRGASAGRKSQRRCVDGTA